MTPSTLGRLTAVLHNGRDRISLAMLTAATAILVGLAASPQLALIANQFKPGNAGSLDANIKKASSPLMDSVEVTAIAAMPLLVVVGIAAWVIGSRKGAESIVKPILFVVAVFSVPGIVA